MIIVDEIGTRAEANAAESIAARGVALVATAHGTCLGDLLKNAQLELLVGGAHSVILSAKEAADRNVTRKTVRERKQAPVFACAVEILSQNKFIVHDHVQRAVDEMLALRCARAQRRTKDDDGMWVEEEVFARNPLSTEDEETEL